MLDFIKEHKDFIKGHFFTVAIVALFMLGFLGGILAPLFQTVINVNFLTLIALIVIIVYLVKQYRRHSDN